MVLSQSLDRLLAAAAIGALIAASGAGVWRALASRSPTELTVGDRFGDLPGFSLATAPVTVLLWIDTRCHACVESMSAFRQIRALLPVRVPIVAVGRESPDELRSFCDRFSVAVDAAIEDSESALRLSAFPRLVVVDRQAVIRALWRGKLEDETAVRQVVAEVERIIHTPQESGRR